jgi:hypothetical protein
MHPVTFKRYEKQANMVLLCGSISHPDNRAATDSQPWR